MTETVSPSVPAARATPQRWRIRVTGIVQGVGYRPFVCNLARALGLAGWVLNDPGGVLVEAQGDETTLERFAVALSADAPPLAKVEHVALDRNRPLADAAEPFEIRHSNHSGRPDTIVPPDSHVCAACLAEMLDPADRRHLYPFVNCTHCGPRYSLIQGLPYDREQTTMSVFTMCPDCRREYEDPTDRRYHAQPNACPVCGPHLLLDTPDGARSEGAEALLRAVEALRTGGIAAVKSVGGFHLAVDARNAAAIDRLRSRKRRDSKPFALMAPDLDTVATFATYSDVEARLMESPARPIVLLRRRPGVLPDAIAPRNPNLGVMLPSAPLHHLLLHESGLDVLVMTSGNVSGYPIAYRNEDALAQLFQVADVILYNNRDIEIRVDDSVVRTFTHPELPQPIVSFARRSRGYAPYPLEVHEDLEPIVAYGAELKTTVALSSGRRAYLSQHIGDLKNDETFQSHLDTADHLVRLHDLTPRYVACDLHPAFRATRFALSRDRQRVQLVQHHHAHMASCMADNRLSGTTLGVVFDGAGYGEDGTIWGGEFLLGDYVGVRRVAHLRHLRLLGGDKAVREPIRTGFAIAVDALGGPDEACAAFPALTVLAETERHVFATMARRGINAPLASSMGRLFDGVAALLGVCGYAEYEAHGPIELEGLLGRDLAPGVPYRFDTLTRDGRTEIDPRPVVTAMAADVAAGAGTSEISRRFHTGVVEMVVEQCEAVRARHGVAQVVVSGGVFLNEFLLVNCVVELRRRGFAAYCHQRVPTNDGGIALGQLMVANARLRGLATEPADALRVTTALADTAVAAQL